MEGACLCLRLINVLTNTKLFLMKLYHYTTIDALALILKNKTLKFSRLDCVDDLEEGRVESSGIKLGKHFFASCWTENPEESIPLWKMYSGDSYGVRISLDKDMFKKYHISSGTYNGISVEGSIECLLPVEEIFYKEYIPFPPNITPSSIDSFFYRKVEYVDDVFKAAEDIVHIIAKDGNKADMKIALGDVGRFKHKRWAFQQETRFVLSFLPINPMHCNPANVSSLVMQAYLSDIHVPFNNYFLHLRDDVFDNLEIVLSPMATKGHRVIVESLCATYAPKAEIRDSSLGTLVKLK